MNPIHALNLGLRFLLELCLLVALAYWGWQVADQWLLRLLFTLGAPLLAAAVWGAWVAPKAARQLKDPARLLLELFLFALGAVALVAAGRPGLGAALLGVFIVNRAVLMRTANGGSV